MTNTEKFKEVFGVDIDEDENLAQWWWDSEYVPPEPDIQHVSSDPEIMGYGK